MYIYKKHVEPLGFKGNYLPISRQFHTHFYHIDKKTRTVTVIGNLTPQTISRFHLTAPQFKAFENGKLSLIPPGCCCATGGKYLDNPEVMFSGDFKNFKHVKEILGYEK